MGPGCQRQVYGATDHEHWMGRARNRSGTRAATQGQWVPGLRGVHLPAQQPIPTSGLCGAALGSPTLFSRAPTQSSQSWVYRCQEQKEAFRV